MADELYWDPFKYELHRDPHPVWRRMRDEAPLYRNDEHDFWAMTRFGDVLDGLMDWKTFSSSKGDQLEVIRGGPPPEAENMILSMDPPRHATMRRLLSRAFTPRSVVDMEPVIRELTCELLDEYAGTTGFDYVADFAAKLPGMVIAVMLGVPPADREYIRRLSDELIARDEGETGLEGFNKVMAELGGYFYGKVLERRENPTDDMMSALLAAEVTTDDGTARRLTDEEAVAYILLLAAAGNETTAKLLGWCGSCFAQFPAERAKLVDDHALIPNAIEEVLRYEPSALCLARVLQHDLTLYDQVVPEGAVMLFIQAATGRDERQFENPDTFDVQRKIDRHLGFAFGPHVCLGAPLARLEGRIAIEETLKRFPQWDVDWDGCEIVHAGSAVRGYSKLPIRVG
jgi:cytochrome P450